MVHWTCAWGSNVQRTLMAFKKAAPNFNEVRSHVMWVAVWVMVVAKLVMPDIILSWKFLEFLTVVTGKA